MATVNPFEIVDTEFGPLRLSSAEIAAYEGGADIPPPLQPIVEWNGTPLWPEPVHYSAPPMLVLVGRSDGVGYVGG